MSLSTQQRKLAAIRGAFVADAASLGVHWVYDPKEMITAVDSVEAPEFKAEPAPQFYSSKDFPGHYEKSMLSPFGEQLLFATLYVAEKKAVDGADMSQAMLKWAETFGGRPDHALTVFIENMKKDDGSGAWPNCGDADDVQDHIFMKLIPVTCLYAGQPELEAKVTEAIRVHQNNDTAVAFGVVAARILEAVILGVPLQEALSTSRANLPVDGDKAVVEAFDRADQAVTEFTSLADFLSALSHELLKDDPTDWRYDFFARSCGLKGVFPGCLYLLHKAANGDLGGKDSDSDYIKAIRQNILAAGDTCGRSTFIGAVLAAASSETLPTSDMIGKVDPEIYAKIEAAAQAIATHN